VCEKERQAGQVREELVAHLKGERIASRVPAEAAARMLALIARTADPGDEEDAGPREAGTLFGAAEVAGAGPSARQGEPRPAPRHRGPRGAP
jgi:hypothetical protein